MNLHIAYSSDNIWLKSNFKFVNNRLITTKLQLTSICFFKLDGEFLKAISSWYLGAQILQRIRKELFLHPTISKNSSSYGQGCVRVDWSSKGWWLIIKCWPTSSLVLGRDISLEFSSWVSATDIFVLGYICLLCPVLGVTSYKVDKTSQFLHGQHTHRTCHPLSMFGMLWIGICDRVFQFLSISSNFAHQILTGFCNTWDLVLQALPLYVCLFKINRIPQL